MDLTNSAKKLNKNEFNRPEFPDKKVVHCRRHYHLYTKCWLWLNIIKYCMQVWNRINMSYLLSRLWDVPLWSMLDSFPLWNIGCSFPLPTLASSSHRYVPIILTHIFLVILSNVLGSSSIWTFRIFVLISSGWRIWKNQKKYSKFVMSKLMS